MQMSLGILTERKIREQEETRDVCLLPELLVKSHICHVAHAVNLHLTKWKQIPVHLYTSLSTSSLSMMVK